MQISLGSCYLYIETWCYFKHKVFAFIHMVREDSVGFSTLVEVNVKGYAILYGYKQLYYYHVNGKKGDCGNRYLPFSS